MHNVKKHAGAISKLLYGKALGISSRTDGQTIHYLTHISLLNLSENKEAGLFLTTYLV